MAWVEVTDARWRALLEFFRNSPSPMQAAVRWVETQGYGGPLGSASTQGNARGLLQSLSRFVPELLAKPVVVMEQQEQGDKTVSVCNHLWIQTLPSVMQTDILTFLSVTRRHFLSKDLVALASTLLASRDTDFWVRLAASHLLCNQNGEFNHQSLLLDQNGDLRGNSALVEEYNSLPSWLEEYKESESVLLLNDLPRRQEDEEEPQVQAEAAINSGANIVPVGGDQEELITSQTNSLTKLGKRKHNEAELQETSSKSQKSQGPENTVPGKENVEDDDENSAREILGDSFFARAKSLGEALQSSASHFGLPSEMDILSNAPNLSVVLKVVKPWLTDDETTNILVGSLLGEQSGYAQSTQILTHVLLPKLINLQEPPSRMLGSAVLQAGKAHPRASIDAIVIPLLEAGSSVKCDIINRVVKECFSLEAASSLCNRLFCEGKLRSCVWTEGTVGVVHTLLSQKVVLEEATLEGLITFLEQYCHQFSTSLKFSNLLLNFVSKYGSQDIWHFAVEHQEGPSEIKRNSCACEPLSSSVKASEIVYFSEELETPKNAENELLGLFNGLLHRLPDSGCGALQWLMGMKERLKAEIAQLDE